jgi:hypothetical protein
VRVKYLQLLAMQRERAAQAAAHAAAQAAAHAAAQAVVHSAAAVSSSEPKGYVMKRLNYSPPRLMESPVLQPRAPTELVSWDKGGEDRNGLVEDGWKEAEEELSPLCIR